MVCGEMRQFNIAVESWKFMDSNECDFYFSSWTTSHQYNKKLNIDYLDLISEETITAKIPNSVVSLIDESTFSHVDELSNKRLNIKSKFHWKNCLSLINKPDDYYDTVLLIRPDLWFDLDADWKSILDNQSDDSFFSNGGIVNAECGDGVVRPMIHDMFLMGKLSMMRKMISSFTDSIPLTHHDLANQILKCNYDVTKIDYFNMRIVRPNVRLHKGLSSKLIDECYFEWAATHSEADVEHLDKKYK